jgi:hypothetical protein
MADSEGSCGSERAEGSCGAERENLREQIKARSDY